MSSHNIAIPDTAPAQSANVAELKTVAGGAAISFAGNISIVTLNVGFQLLLARLLGSENVGVFALALSIVHIASFLAMSGLQKGIVRFIAFYAERADQRRMAGVMLDGVRIVGGTSIIAALLLFSLADVLATRVFNTPELGPVLRWMALSLPCTAVMGLLLSVAQGFKRMEHRAIIEQMVVPALKIVTVVIIVYVIGYGVVGAAFAVVVASVGGVVLAAISAWRLYPLRGQDQQPIRVTRELATFSWPLVVTAIVNQAWLETETLILGALAPNDQVGIYYVSLRTTALLTIFLTAFTTVFAPVIAGLYSKNDHAQLGTLLKTVTKWAFSLSLPFCLLLLILSEDILRIFGPDFVGGADALRILAIAKLFNVATGPLGSMLTMSKYPHLNLINFLVSLGLSLSLAFMLIPTYGLVGAAVSSAVSTIVFNTLGLIEVYVLLRLQPYNLSYVKPVVAGLLAVGAALGLQVFIVDIAIFWKLATVSSLLCLVYGAALVALRLDEADQLILAAVRRRLVRFIPGGRAR